MIKNKSFVPPRNVPSRDEKYMGLALIYSGLSKDPSTQMGCIIVGEDNIPVSFGYNGPPSTIDDTLINWDRPDKYDYILHAEDNAIDFAMFSLDSTIMYVTGLPCKRCMLRIASKCIPKVCYLHREYDAGSMQANKENIAIVKNIANLANIKLYEFSGNLSWLEDHTMNLRKLGILDKNYKEP